MKVLLDTNIVIDIFTKREPGFEGSYAALNQLLSDDDNKCFFSASAVTDVFYIISRQLHDRSKTREVIDKLLQIATIADVTSAEIQSALISPMSDFEDAVIVAVAKKYKASYILTRNIKDFVGSAVKTVTPEMFLRDNA